jgi:hypothetical protein
LQSCKCSILFKRDSVTKCFDSGFYHKLSSPKPLKITFQIFIKLVEIFASQCGPPVSTSPVNLPPVSTTQAANFANDVNYTGGKFATGVNYTGRKFATSIKDTSRKVAEIFESQGATPVSTTPLANLPPVSTRHRWQIIGTISHFKMNRRKKMFLSV